MQGHTPVLPEWLAWTSVSCPRDGGSAGFFLEGSLKVKFLLAYRSWLFQLVAFRSFSGFGLDVLLFQGFVSVLMCCCFCVAVLSKGFVLASVFGCS
ncbi:hypothetical protein U1Q18_013470 [Sarracenia purpurea var. burkii]